MCISSLGVRLLYSQFSGGKNTIENRANFLRERLLHSKFSEEKATIKPVFLGKGWYIASFLGVRTTIKPVLLGKNCYKASFFLGGGILYSMFSGGKAATFVYSQFSGGKAAIYSNFLSEFS